MKVNSIQSSNIVPSRTKSRPNFEASLHTSNNLANYFNYKVGNMMWYNINMRALAQRLSFLPDRPIMITLNDEASRLFNRGIMPHEPAAEVHIGKPLYGDYVTVESEKVPVDITTDPSSFPEKVYNIAKRLIYAE